MCANIDKKKELIPKAQKTVKGEDEGQEIGHCTRKINGTCQCSINRISSTVPVSMARRGRRMHTAAEYRNKDEGKDYGYGERRRA